VDSTVSAAPKKDVAAFAEAAAAIVGRENVRAATAADAVSGVQPQLVVAPGSENELAQVLKLANDNDITILPRGGGTKMTWGNPPKRADVILSTARLNRVLEHSWSDLTVTVEAGCTFLGLASTVSFRRQRLALDALWPSHATIGGTLSTNDSGRLRLRFGSLRDLVIGVTLVLADGTIAKSGGKVVKNVAGYDLPKLVTGAFGTLGVITQATFRLHPYPIQSRTISCVMRDAREAQRLLLAILDSQLAHSALQIRFEASSQPQLDVVFEATEAGCAAQTDQLKNIVAPAAMIDSSDTFVWYARQELYSQSTAMGRNNAGAASPVASAVGKVAVLPTQIAEAYDTLATAIAANHANLSAVFYATGIGTIFVASAPKDLAAVLKQLRVKIETIGGSLEITHRPEIASTADAWGDVGNTLALTRGVKKEFDPKSTLNPGRFVGGI
jgi:glycolate oxidase FAD binding subunit